MKSCSLKPHGRKWDDKALKADEILIVVQINGKLRSKITVPADATDKELEEISLKDSKIRDLIAGNQVRKVVVVPKISLSGIVAQIRQYVNVNGGTATRDIESRPPARRARIPHASLSR